MLGIRRSETSESANRGANNEEYSFISNHSKNSSDVNAIGLPKPSRLSARRFHFKIMVGPKAFAAY